MTTPAHDIGDRRRYSVELRNLAGQLASPDQLTFRMVAPDGTPDVKTWPTDPEVVEDETGKFHRDFTFAMAGRHRYRWEATGAVETAEGGEVYIRRPRTE